MTKYAILSTEGGVTWIFEKTIEAHSPEHAVRLYVGDHEDRSGRYVAVPERSWKPIEVEVEVEHRVRVLTPESAATQADPPEEPKPE